jgi:hypothetical protein
MKIDSTKITLGRLTLSTRTLWLAGFIVALALAARIIPGPRTIDDAYITFRYARHILAGEGFTFNAGEHVLGTTTPLYTLLMAFLGSLAGGTAAPFPILALAVNALADSLTCLILWRLGAKLGHPLAGIAGALVWAIAPYSVTFAIGGMETSVCVLLMSITALLYMEGKTRCAFFAGGLMVLTRPDTLILVGLLGLGRMWSAFRARALWPMVLDGVAFLAPILPWLIFAGVYFGSPIPHSITAKSLAYHLDAGAAFVRLLQHYATPFYDQAALGIPAIGIGLVLYPFLTIVGINDLLRKNARVWPLVIFPWLYFLVYSLANPLIFRWYLTPPLPFYILGILVGAEILLHGIGRVLQKLPALRTRPGAERFVGHVPLALLAVPMAFSAAGWTLTPDHGLSRPAPQMAYYQLELLYAQAAAIVEPELKPGDVLAAGDVGVLGYQTNTPILDTVGLNSPLSSKYYPLPADDYVINYAIPSGLILKENPRVVVFPEIYGRNTLLKNDEFLSRYRLLKTIETDIYGSRGLLIYVRSVS